ncbi:MAG: AhpC/TSA family protein [Paludibacteraceae bacterium]|nr:AhpC/TSA family protein [Paludibacteraceae bacterium]
MKAKYVFLGLMAMAIVACQKAQFKVEGVLKGAENQTIYLEQAGMLGKTIIDSTNVSGSGKFKLSAARPAYPELYTLRVAGKTIVVAVDSLETIGIEGSLEDVLNIRFDESPKSAQIAALRQSLRTNNIADHKQKAIDMIMADPKSVVAYYALFQQKDGEPVFKLWEKGDRVFYQAVATSWATWMPENERAKVLYQQVLDQMNAERHAQSSELVRAYIEEQEASAFLDIEMCDENGEKQNLSSLKGKVVLLDFCSMQMDEYDSYCTSLYSRYEAYHQAGLEIYQVYPDLSVIAWKERVKQLPWITVRAEGGLTDQVFTTYNVQSLPTCFLIDRRGEVVGRYVGFYQINEKIEELLKN